MNRIASSSISLILSIRAPRINGALEVTYYYYDYYLSHRVMQGYLMLQLRASDLVALCDQLQCSIVIWWMLNRVAELLFLEPLVWSDCASSRSILHHIKHPTTRPRINLPCWQYHDFIANSFFSLRILHFDIPQGNFLATKASESSSYHSYNLHGTAFSVAIQVTNGQT